MSEDSIQIKEKAHNSETPWAKNSVDNSVSFFSVENTSN